MSDDLRIVYSVGCTWWGSIGEASRKPSGLPCTPCCGAVMMEVATEVEWWAGVDDYEKQGIFGGYRGFIEWLRGKCYPNIDAALEVYVDE